MGRAIFHVSSVPDLSLVRLSRFDWWRINLLIVKIFAASYCRETRRLEAEPTSIEVSRRERQNVVMSEFVLSGSTFVITSLPMLESNLSRQSDGRETEAEPFHAFRSFCRTKISLNLGWSDADNLSAPVITEELCPPREASFCLHLQPLIYL